MSARAVDSIERRPWLTTRRRIVLCLAAIGLGAILSAAAWAYWAAPPGSNGQGAALAATVNGGATPTASTSAQNVTVTWGASTLSNGVAVTGYVVKRYDTSNVLQTITSGCAGTVTALSCVEATAPAGSWKYSVTPVLGNWSGAESAKSGTVTVSYTTVLTLSQTLFTTPFPKTVTGTLTGFQSSEGIAYRLDAGTTLTGSPTTATAGGSATITSLSIPSAVDGAHTVWALGNATPTASSTSTGIVIDTTAPVLTATLSPTANAAAWNNSSPVTVTLSANDGTGSGVNLFKYTTDGTDPSVSGTAVSYTTPFTVAVTKTVKYYATDVAGNSASGTKVVSIDTAAPTNAITMTSLTGFASKSGNTIYYKGSATGHFTLTNTLTDSGTSGAKSSSTAALSGTTTGWTHTASTVTGSSPYVSNQFTWTSTGGSSPSVVVTGSDAADNTNLSTLTFVDDSAGPIGGSINYRNGSSTGAVAVTFASGTDSPMGLKANSGLLQRADATLTNGACQSYSAFATVTGGTNPASPFSDTSVVSGNCYKYQYLYYDNFDNFATYTSTNVVKVTTYANAVKYESGTVAQYRLGDPAPFVVDDIDGSGTLDSRTGAVGATWTRNANTTFADTTLSISPNFRIYKTTATSKGALYTASGAPSSADYGVEAEFSLKSVISGDAAAIIGRYTVGTGAGTYYMARRENTTGPDASVVKLYKVVNGVKTLLGGPVTVSADAVTAGWFRLTLLMSGSSIRVVQYGLPIISVTDSSIAGTGVGGVVMGDVYTGATSVTTSNTTGMHIDNFRVYPVMKDNKGTADGGYYSFPQTGVPSPGAIAGDANSAITLNSLGTAPANGNQDNPRPPGGVGLTTNMSIEFWYKPGTQSGNGMGQWYAGAALVDGDIFGNSGNDWGVSLESDGSVAAGTGNYDTTINSGSGYGNNAWHYVVFTRSAAGAMKLYVDGVLRATGTGPSADRDGTIIPRIGRQAGDGTHAYIGAIDEVAFYNQVLNATAVADHYTLGVGSDTTGPVDGGVTPTGLTGTGPSYTSSTTINLTLDKGTDAIGVAATGAQLRRSTATLTSNGTADGTCGTYSASTLIASDPPLSTTDTIPSATACYRYEYKVNDTSGNLTTYYSSDIKMDITGPAAPTFTFSAGQNAYANGSVVSIDRASTDGQFTVTAAGSDGDSGVASYTFPSLGNGWSVSGTGASRTYSWSAANPDLPGTVTATATNNAGGIGSTGSFSFVDVTPAELPAGYTPCAIEGGTCTFTGNRMIAYGAGSYVYKWVANVGSIACTSAAFAGADPAPGVLKSCFVPPTGGPPGWASCAAEDATCSVTGTKMVMFGDSGGFMPRLVTTSQLCSLGAMGSDPAMYDVKSCYTAPAGAPRANWTQCATQGNTCTAAAGQQLAYGAFGAFNYITASGNTTCSTVAFGDPLPGTTKACYSHTDAPSDSPTQCAVEGGSCLYAGTKAVAYGARGQYIYKSFQGNAGCNTANFGGDPLPNVAKLCFTFDHVTVTNPGAQSGYTGTAASLQISATSTASGSLTYSASNLPAGLSINASTGLISGTPTTVSAPSVTVTATGPGGAANTTTFTWTIAQGCVSAQLLGNGDFENSASWTVAGPSPTVSTTSAPVHGGTHKGLLGGNGTTGTESFTQQVTLGAQCTSARLSFWLQIATAETTTTTAYDKFYVQVLNTSNTVLATLNSPYFSNLDKAAGYAKFTYSVGAWAGQTIKISFTETEDTSSQTSFSIDDAALDTTASVSITDPGAQTSVINTADTLQIAATTTGSGTLSYAASGLPTGLSINSSTGLISGTPTALGSSGVTITVTDSTGPTSTLNLTWTVSSVDCSPAQYLGNPGFEATAGSAWTLGSGASRTTSTTHAGTYKAEMGGATAGTDTMYYAMTIPAGCDASFKYWRYITTSEANTDGVEYDSMQVSVLNSTGSSTLATFGRFSNLDDTGSSWVQSPSYDLSPWAGTAIRLQFTVSTDSSVNTSFYLDDTTLDISAPATGCTGSQLLSNPGFENGATTTPWVFGTGAGPVTGGTPTPRTGSWDGVLGVQASSSENMRYSVAIPSGCKARLRYWYNLTTAEPADGISPDWMTTEVWDSTGTTLLASWGSLGDEDSTSANGWVQSGAYDLSAWAGQTVRIKLTSHTDSSATTTWSFDDATLDTR